MRPVSEAPAPSDSTADGTRQRLLEATRAGLARFGSRRLSMTDVAELAGVSRRTLYRYFPSMEQLLDALIEDDKRRFDAGIADVVREHPPGHRLGAALAFMSAGLSDERRAQLVATEPAFVLKQFTEILPTQRESLTKLIMQEQAAKGVPRRVAEDLADAIIRLTLAHYLLPEPDPERFDRSVAAIVSAVLGPQDGASPTRTTGARRRTR
jgi:AcrR family transcriptional regulator